MGCGGSKGAETGNSTGGQGQEVKKDDHAPADSTQQNSEEEQYTSIADEMHERNENSFPAEDDSEPPAETIKDSSAPADSSENTNEKNTEGEKRVTPSDQSNTPSAEVIVESKEEKNGNTAEIKDAEKTPESQAAANGDTQLVKVDVTVTSPAAEPDTATPAQDGGADSSTSKAPAQEQQEAAATDPE